VRPAEQIVRTSQASNLKGQRVVFGISRPTRTPTAGSPQGGEAANRGLDYHDQSPGTGGRRPDLSRLPQDSTYAVAPPPHPRPATTADSAGSCSRAGGATRGPGDGAEATFRKSRPTVRPAERTGSTTACYHLAAVGAATRAHLLPTTGQCRPPCAPDSDGTCQLPASTRISPILRRQ
jgi:hypothetical protein